MALAAASWGAGSLTCARAHVEGFMPWSAATSLSWKSGEDGREIQPHLSSNAWWHSSIVFYFQFNVFSFQLIAESYSLFFIYTTGVSMQLVVCDSPAGRLGLTICYDLRFPEVYQALTFRHQAEILLVPSAFTKLTGTADLPHT